MPPDWTIRGARPEDEAAVLELENAHSRVMWGEGEDSADEVRQAFTDPNVELERDFLLAEDAAGRLAGISVVEDAATDHSLIWLRLALHPERGTDELGDALLEAAERRAAERVAPGTVMRGGCAAPDELAARVRRNRGFRLVRHFFRMEAPLEHPPAAPAWPEGIELRPVDLDGDLHPLFLADEEAFEDHWGNIPISYETWFHWMTGATCDPTLWFVAYDGAEIAGLALCKPEQGGDASFGWVEVLAVRRRWRRRGLALALLLHAFGEFHRRGHTRVGLGVDGENTTGAVRLYERAGMHPVRQSDIYEREL